MAQFGGNEFTTFSVPLVFEGRYFVLEPGNPPLLTVFSEKDGKPVFEVLKNQPVENALARVGQVRALLDNLDGDAFGIGRTAGRVRAAWARLSSSRIAFS
jgi:hypothetical protein